MSSNQQANLAEVNAEVPFTVDVVGCFLMDQLRHNKSLRWWELNWFKHLVDGAHTHICLCPNAGAPLKLFWGRGVGAN